MHSAMLSILLFVSLAGAQTAPPPAPQGNPRSPAPSASNTSTLAPGTIIPAELSKSLDARKTKVGDKVEAKASVDLLSHGQIVLPRNTKIVGHITAVKPRGKDSQDCQVALTFDRIVFKDGRAVPLQAAVQAIGRPLQSFGQFEPVSQNPGAMIPVNPPGQGGSMGGPGNPRSVPQSPYPIDARPDPDTPPGTPNGTTTVAPLGPTSEGMVGIKGLSLSASGTTATVSSSTQNVHLDGGSQLILKTQ